MGRPTQARCSIGSGILRRSQRVESMPKSVRSFSIGLFRGLGALPVRDENYQKVKRPLFILFFPFFLLFLLGGLWGFFLFVFFRIFSFCHMVYLRCFLYGPVDWIVSSILIGTEIARLNIHSAPPNSDLWQFLNLLNRGYIVSNILNFNKIKISRHFN